MINKLPAEYLKEAIKKAEADGLDTKRITKREELILIAVGEAMLKQAKDYCTYIRELVEQVNQSMKPPL